MDQYSEAVVTLSSTDAGVTATERIVVGLWRGSAPAALRVMNLGYREMVADPVAPYVYAHNRGTAIDVYHLYSGAKLATLASNAAALGTMTVAPDGSSLYATDTTRAKVLSFNLATRTQVATWDLQRPVKFVYPHNRGPELEYIKPNGTGVILVSDGTALFAANGALANGATAVVPPADEVQVYPNPSANGQYALVLPETFAGAVSYRLVSALGATVATGTLGVAVGGAIMPLDFTAAMPATGLYYLLLASPQRTARLKLIRL